MQVAVKWVYQAVKGPHGTKMEAGQKPSLCFRGREYMLCVAAAHPVRVFKRPVRDFDVLRTVTVQVRQFDKGGQPVLDDKGQQVVVAHDYEVKDAVQRLRDIASRNGITIGASRLLDRALQEAAEVKEDEYEDEEELTGMETTTTETTDGTAPIVPAENTQKQETANVAKKTKKAKAKTEPKVKKTAAAKPAKAKKAAKAKSADGKAPSGRRTSKKLEAYPVFKKHKEKLGRKEPPRGWITEVANDIVAKVDTNFGSANDYVRAFLKGEVPKSE